MRHPRYYAAVPFHYTGLAFGWLIGWITAPAFAFYCATKRGVLMAWFDTIKVVLKK